MVKGSKVGRAAAVTAAVAAGLATTATGAHAATRPAARPLMTLSAGPVVPDGQYRMTVATDGRVTLTRDDHRARHLTLGAHALARLQSELTATHFERLKRDYAVPRGKIHPVGAYPDVLTADGRTVTVDPGGTPPATLAKLVATLEAIADKLF